MSAEVWRVGRKLGRTLYVNDEVIGMVDTPELAARIVAAMNAADAEVARTESAGEPALCWYCLGPKRIGEPCPKCGAGAS